MDKLKDQLNALKDQTLVEEDVVNSKILKLQDSIHQFEIVDREIKAYGQGGGDGGLNAVKRAVGDLELRITFLEEEIARLSDAISDAERNIASLKQFERSVADNLQYRKYRREINEMQAKVTEMEKQNAEAEVDNYREQADKLRKANNKWTAEVHVT